MKRRSSGPAGGRPSAMDNLADLVRDGTLRSPEDLRAHLSGNYGLHATNLRAALKEPLPHNPLLPVFLSMAKQGQQPVDVFASLVTGLITRRETARVAKEHNVSIDAVAVTNPFPGYERVRHARFPLAELAWTEKQRSGNWPAVGAVTLDVFVREFQLHIINFMHDPPVRNFVTTMQLLERRPDATQSRLMLAAMCMATGRGHEVQQAYFDGRLGLHEISRSGIRDLEDDLMACKLAALGDFATTETKLWPSTSSYFCSRLLESIWELADDEARARDLAAASSASEAAAVLRKVRGYGQPFRSGHIALWLSAWRGLEVDMKPEETIGPNPKSFLAWAKELEALGYEGFNFEELLAAVRQLWERQAADGGGFQVAAAGGPVAVPMMPPPGVEMLQFTLCKAVQLISAARRGGQGKGGGS